MRKSNLFYVLFISIFLFSFSFINWHNEFEFFYFDLITGQINQDLDSSITVIAITKEDIKQLKQYPVSDDLLAFLINELSFCSPQKVILDIFFSPYGQQENDLLSHSFQKFSENPIICGVPLEYLRENNFNLYRNTIRYGNSNILLAEDGFARPIPNDDQLYPSIINCIADDTVLSKNILLIPPYYQIKNYRHLNFIEALNKVKLHDYKDFTGKTIFIGYHLAGVSPFFKDPGSHLLCSGLNMQVNYFNSIQTKNFIPLAPKSISLLISFLIILIAGITAFYYPLRKGLYITTALIFTFFISHLFLAYFKIYYFTLFYSFIASLIQFIILSFICSYRNERKLFKQLLKDQQIIQFIINQVEGFVILFNSNGEIVYKNHQAEENIELLQSTSCLQNKTKSLLEGNENRIWWEEELNGKIYRALLIRHAGNRIIKDENLHLYMAINISENIEMRKKIKEKEHLAAIGQMAAGIAHEIRNPLAGLELTALSIREMAADQLNLQEYTENMVLAIKSLNRFVSEFLEFSKVTMLEKRDSDIKKVIDDSLFMLDFDHKDISIEKKYDETSLYINIDPDKLRQVFLNIFKNSIQQYQDSGNIEISIIEDSDKIIVIIIDNGGGMDKEVLKQAFNPFFTTRAEGTGLGLSICSRLIEAHNGEIKVSNYNNGLKVEIILKRKVENK